MTVALRSVVNRDGKLFEIATFSEPSSAESRAVLTGAIELVPGRGRTRVFAFVNDRRDVPGQTFISLTARNVDEGTGEIGYIPVAIGNVVNERRDGGDVYFDTVIFNPVDRNGRNIPGSQPVSVYVTRECDPSLHAKLGFAQARVQRPAKNGAASPEGGTDGIVDEGADPAAQAAMVAAAAGSINV